MDGARWCLSRPGRPCGVTRWQHSDARPATRLAAPTTPPRSVRRAAGYLPATRPTSNSCCAKPSVGKANRTRERHRRRPPPKWMAMHDVAYDRRPTSAAVRERDRGRRDIASEQSMYRRPALVVDAGTRGRSAWRNCGESDGARTRMATGQPPHHTLRPPQSYVLVHAARIICHARTTHVSVSQSPPVG